MIKWYDNQLNDMIIIEVYQIEICLLITIK